MRIKSLFIILISFITSSAFALNLRDSVGVENKDGRQVIIHKIEAKETYYVLGRKYGVAVKTIMNFNDSKPLHPGTIIRVPTERPFGAPAAVPVQASAGAAAAGEIIEYKVGPKETLFAIAKKFGTTVDDIRQLNDMRSTSLSIGQMIRVRQAGNTAAEVNAINQQHAEEQAAAMKPATPPAEKDHTSVLAPPDTSAMDMESKVKQNRYGIRQHEEKGVGVWIEDENIDGSKMLALHNTVPPGTVVRITNPMNGKSTFVKVLGGYTEKESTKGAIIVITKAVADLIGVLDKRFQVSIAYGIPNEN